MTIREVRLFGDPVLNTRADEVTQFDDALKTLVEDMLDTMDEYDGVGLAANPLVRKSKWVMRGACPFQQW